MLTIAPFLLLPGLSFGQSSDYHHNQVYVGGGAAVPVGNATSYLQTAPLFSFGYGYRFNRYLQADAGVQIAFGAAHNQNIEQTDFGTVQGSDHEYIIPIGGRVIIPTPFKRIEVSAGGGAAHLHYSETISSNGSYYTPSCYSCTSRGGWGGYGVANVSYFLDSNQNFHVGTTIQYISASTKGQPVGNVTAFSSKDHWTTLSFEVGLSF